MKALKIAIVSLLVLHVAYSFYNWVSESPSLQISESLSIPAAEGLKLPALAGLIKEIRSGQELERRLNEEKGINNLDLNGDEKVDYIHVTEFGDPEKKIGYSLTVQPAKDETQEVAEVQIEKNNDRAEIQVQGNEQIYGENSIYNDWAPIESKPASATPASGTGESAARASYFYPHSHWISPFFFGFYPSYFSFFPIIPTPIYNTTVTRYVSPSVTSGRNQNLKTSDQSFQSPNKGKVANRGITRSLSNPTGTQKQFMVNQSRKAGSGGFGLSKVPTDKKSTFGTRSFGSSSAGKSFRSGGSSSRSFGGFGK